VREKQVSWSKVAWSGAKPEMTIVLDLSL